MAKKTVAPRLLRRDPSTVKASHDHRVSERLQPVTERPEAAHNDGSAQKTLSRAERWVLLRIFERGFCLPDASVSHAAERAGIQGGRKSVLAAFQSLEHSGLIVHRNGAFFITQDGECEITRRDDPCVSNLGPDQAERWYAGRWLLRYVLAFGFCVKGLETLEMVVRGKAANDLAVAAEAFLFLERRGWIRRHQATCLFTGNIIDAQYFELTESGRSVAQWAKAHAKRLGDPVMAVPCRHLPRPWFYYDIE